MPLFLSDSAESYAAYNIEISVCVVSIIRLKWVIVVLNSSDPTCTLPKLYVTPFTIFLLFSSCFQD